MHNDILQTAKNDSVKDSGRRKNRNVMGEREYLFYPLQKIRFM